MNTQTERIVLNDDNAVDWQGPGYYKSFTIAGESRNIWQKVGEIIGGSNSYYATLVQRWQDLINKQPAP